MFRLCNSTASPLPVYSPMSRSFKAMQSTLQQCPCAYRPGGCRGGAGIRRRGAVALGSLQCTPESHRGDLVGSEGCDEAGDGDHIRQHGEHRAGSDPARASAAVLGGEDRPRHGERHPSHVHARMQPRAEALAKLHGPG